MVSINKSFLYGICFASITWLISLYLYIRLTDNEIRSTQKPIQVSLRNFNQIDTVRIKDDSYWKSKRNRYINSNELRKKLQPIVRKSKFTKKHDKDLDELGLVKSFDDQNKKDEGYKRHAFNVLISERLSYHRDIPDTRNALCKDINYPDNLPEASIIICFYNEHYATLLRTIHSIIDRTPARYLKEIVLIDDYSDLENLHTDLQDYIVKNFVSNKVKLFKTEQREGLIRARLFGVKHSEGDVLVFLDSHIEVNTEWIQPLLLRIKENRTNVVMPIIDIINADTFAYTASPLVRGGFNWGLHFKWENLPKGTLLEKSDFIKPIKSPTMAGGLFAINRQYFIELGEYDPGMNIWGGENLEISFRIWMCGGQLELIPCSRVGHVFRQRRPYGSPTGEDTMLYNSLRVAHVWMDDYKKYFLEQRTDANSLDFGDISARIALRQRLKCYDFDWYLKNVYPEQTLPTDNRERLKKKWAALERDQFQPWHLRQRTYIDQFQIKLTNTSLCIQSAKDVKTKGSGLILKKCVRTKNQMWYETDRNELVLAQLLCLQASKPAPILFKCHEMGSDQEWKHKGQNNSPIYNIAAGTCLAAKRNAIGAEIVMKFCTDSDLIHWDIAR